MGPGRTLEWRRIWARGWNPHHHLCDRAVFPGPKIADRTAGSAYRGCTQRLEFSWRTHSCVPRRDSSRRRSSKFWNRYGSLPSCWCAIATLLLTLGAGVANAGKLSLDERVAIMRGLMAEYATARVTLPSSKKPLKFPSDGKYDRNAWEKELMEHGQAARVG